MALSQDVGQSYLEFVALSRYDMGHDTGHPHMPPKSLLADDFDVCVRSTRIHDLPGHVLARTQRIRVFQ